VIIILSVLQALIDAFLVSTLLPLAIMADYSIALLVFEQFRRLWGIYVAVRYPKLVLMPVECRRKRFVSEGSIIFFGFIILGCVVSLLGQWLIPLVLPSSYVSSLGYMYLLIASVVAGTPGSLAETYFRTQQDEKSQYKMRIVSAIVGVVAPFLLVYHWGAYGAATGHLVANITYSSVGVWFFRREYNQKE